MGCQPCMLAVNESKTFTSGNSDEQPRTPKTSLMGGQPICRWGNAKILLRLVRCSKFVLEIHFKKTHFCVWLPLLQLTAFKVHYLQPVLDVSLSFHSNSSLILSRGQIFQTSHHYEYRPFACPSWCRDECALFDWTDLVKSTALDLLPTMPRPRKRTAFTGHLPSPSETPNGDAIVPSTTQASPVFFICLPQYQPARGRPPCRLPGVDGKWWTQTSPTGDVPRQSCRGTPEGVVAKPSYLVTTKPPRT